MIYDGFTFFNEFDLLDIRLRELDKVVDKFILVEATKTFQKKSKPLFYKENKKRYKDFHHKIIHIVVDQYPNFFSRFRVPRTWDYENNQREYILKGLESASDNDTVIISDLDEIPRPEKIQEYKDKQGVHVFEQHLACYFINNMCSEITTDPNSFTQSNKHGWGWWRGSVMIKKKDLKDVMTTRLLRDKEGPSQTVIPDGGWHLSYMGGVKSIINKIESFSHKEFNTDNIKDEASIKKAISQGVSIFDSKMKFKAINIDKHTHMFPKTVIDNQDKYKHLIIEAL